MATDSTTPVTDPWLAGESLSLDELRLRLGQEVGLSQWWPITQERIDRFAEATDDHYFIHVDPERAGDETPFGGTIAHGFLTLSLLSAFAYDALPKLRDRVLGMNYGFDKIRFIAPVPAGSRIRARFALAGIVERAPKEVMVRYAVTVEIEGAPKPALIADWLTFAVLERHPS